MPHDPTELFKVIDLDPAKAVNGFLHIEIRRLTEQGRFDRMINE